MYNVFKQKSVVKEKIIDCFISEYMAGRTPVPCGRCNNYLKWPLLIDIANKENAFYVSTGHYIKTVSDNGRLFITAGQDPDKDQSFFMWGLHVSIMERMLLPLGDMTKQEVREYAAGKGFSKVSLKKDSLGVCFCPGDYRDFLNMQPECKNIEEGHFVDTNGEYS